MQHGMNMNTHYDFRKCTGLKVKPRQGDGLLFYSLLPNGTIDKVIFFIYVLIYECNSSSFYSADVWYEYLMLYGKLLISWTMNLWWQRREYFLLMYNTGVILVENDTKKNKFMILYCKDEKFFNLVIRRQNY